MVSNVLFEVEEWMYPVDPSRPSSCPSLFNVVHDLTELVGGLDSPMVSK